MDKEKLEIRIQKEKMAIKKYRKKLFILHFLSVLAVVLGVIFIMSLIIQCGNLFGGVR